MRRLLASASFAVLLAVTLGGCAGGGPLMPRRDGAATTQPSAMTAQRAFDAIAPGRTTQADLTRTLGKAIVIHFDSGYEVWVYRWDGAGGTTHAATELVVLVNREGVVTKARVRPPLA